MTGSVSPRTSSARQPNSDPAAEQVDTERNRRRTYHRWLRFPKRVDDEDIDATYDNGILEVHLPVTQGATARGKRIEVEG